MEKHKELPETPRAVASRRDALLAAQAAKAQAGGSVSSPERRATSRVAFKAEPVGMITVRCSPSWMLRYGEHFRRH